MCKERKTAKTWRRLWTMLTVHHFDLIKKLSGTLGVLGKISEQKVVFAITFFMPSVE